MHNLHLCVIRAASAEEAESEVDNSIGEWGNDNNWYTICGSVSEDDDLHVVESDRFVPTSERFGTIAKINDWFRALVSEKYHGRDTGLAALRQIATGQDVSDPLLIRHAECYLRYMRWILDAKLLGTAPDVLKQEFNPGEFDEAGVSHIGNLGDGQHAKRFVVFMHMHS